MILNLGDFPSGATVYVPFHTFDSNDPSASVTMTGLAVTDIEIYKNGSVTQRSSDAGYTLLDTDGIDFDGVTGLHGFSIDTSDNTDSGFYATGAEYWVAVSSITVDGATVNFWAAVFSIERSGGTATILTDTEAVLTDSEAIIADSEAVLADTEATVADTNELQTDWANGGRLDLIVDAVLADTEAVLTDAEAILADTNELQTDWTNAGRLDAILDAVLVDTEQTQTDAGTIITDTEALLVDTEAVIVDTEAVLADTEALGSSGLTPLASGTAQSGTAGTIVLAASAAFADNELNGNVIKITGGTGAGQSRLILSNTNADDTCNVSPNWTTNPSSDSVYEIVEGAANVVAVSLTAQTAGDIIADTEAVLTDAEAVLADTNELQTDWTNAGRLDAILDAVLVDTEAATAVITDTEAILTDTEQLRTDAGTIITDTEAVLADTNELQTDWANAGRLDAILDAVLADTEAAVPVLTDTEAILADTEAAVADTEAVLADTEAVLVDTEATNVAAIADGVWDESRADHTAQGTYGENMNSVISGTVDTVTNTHTPTTTEFQADDITEATADHFIGRVVVFTTGALDGQATDITDYAAVGGIAQFTVTAMTEAPSNNDQFVII